MPSFNLKAIHAQSKIVGGAGKRIRVKNTKRLAGGGNMTTEIKFTFPTKAAFEKAMQEIIDPAMKEMTETVIDTARRLMQSTQRRSRRPTRKITRRKRSHAELKAMFARIKQHGSPSKTGHPPAVQSGNLKRSLIARQLKPGQYLIASPRAPYGALHEFGYEGGKRPYLRPAMRIVQKDDSAMSKAFKGVL